MHLLGYPAADTAPTYPGNFSFISFACVLVNVNFFIYTSGHIINYADNSDEPCKWYHTMWRVYSAAVCRWSKDLVRTVINNIGTTLPRDRTVSLWHLSRTHVEHCLMFACTDTSPLCLCVVAVAHHTLHSIHMRCHAVLGQRYLNRIQ